MAISFAIRWQQRGYWNGRDYAPPFLRSNRAMHISPRLESREPTWFVDMVRYLKSYCTRVLFTGITANWYNGDVVADNHTIQIRYGSTVLKTASVDIPRQSEQTATFNCYYETTNTTYCQNFTNLNIIHTGPTMSNSLRTCNPTDGFIDAYFTIPDVGNAIVKVDTPVWFLALQEFLNTNTTNFKHTTSSGTVINKGSLYVRTGHDRAVSCGGGGTIGFDIRSGDKLLGGSLIDLFREKYFEYDERNA